MKRLLYIPYIDSYYTYIIYDWHFSHSYSYLWWIYVMLHLVVDQGCSFKSMVIFSFALRHGNMSHQNCSNQKAWDKCHLLYLIASKTC